MIWVYSYQDHGCYPCLYNEVEQEQSFNQKVSWQIKIKTIGDWKWQFIISGTKNTDGDSTVTRRALRVNMSNTFFYIILIKLLNLKSGSIRWVICEMREKKVNANTKRHERLTRNSLRDHETLCGKIEDFGEWANYLTSNSDIVYWGVGILIYLWFDSSPHLGWIGRFWIYSFIEKCLFRGSEGTYVQITVMFIFVTVISWSVEPELLALWQAIFLFLAKETSWQLYHGTLGSRRKAVVIGATWSSMIVMNSFIANHL